jgi:2'-5' RNA ligase
VSANLFVAVVPPPEALAPLAHAVAELRTTTSALAWVAPDRWHVTVCFLGPVDPTEALAERLSRAGRRHRPVPLRIAGAGHFGERVLWAGVEGDLRPLAAGVSRAAAKAGFAIEERDSHAHLTLARTRRSRVDLRPLVRELAGVPGAAWTAEEFVLMRAATPHYLRLASWPLGGDGPRPGAPEGPLSGLNGL